MPVFAHAQQHEVKDRAALSVSGQEAVDHLSGDGGCVCRFVFPADTMDLGCRDFQRVQQMFPGQAEIALRVIRRHAPLIAPKKPHVPKAGPTSARLIDRRIKEPTDHPSARQRDVKKRIPTRRRLDRLKPARGCCGGQRASVGEGKHLHGCHSLGPSVSIRTRVPTRRGPDGRKVSIGRPSRTEARGVLVVARRRWDRVDRPDRAQMGNVGFRRMDICHVWPWCQNRTWEPSDGYQPTTRRKAPRRH